MVHDGRQRDAADRQEVGDGWPGDDLVDLEAEVRRDEVIHHQEGGPESQHDHGRHAEPARGFGGEIVGQRFGT